jgi:hypothetical protein
VWFRLLTGADEKKLPALKRNAGDRMLSAMLAFRVAEVEGVDDRERRRFLEDLGDARRDFLVDEFDRVDCGVDTAIEIECPECFAQQEVQLPFDQTFFLPGKGRTARRRERSGSSPVVDLDRWREGLFQLCWRQHGGSGLGVTMGEALDLDTVRPRLAAGAHRRAAVEGGAGASRGAGKKR